MQIVGVTGGIASGKSTVTRMLAALGARTHSADEDARAVLADGSPTLAVVFDAFPEARGSDGGLDRAALARRIFTDPAARARLEAITHPAIIRRMEESIAAARQAGPGVLAYETPLLFEADLERLFDTIIVVLATREKQAERLQARERSAGRRALTAEEIAGRLNAQIAPEEKARRADAVIRTDGTLKATQGQVRELWERLTAPT